MLEKSLARELDFEKRLSDLRYSEEDLKLKLHYAEREVYCMEELMEICLERAFEAENAAEILLGTSEELAGRVQVLQLNLNSSQHQEHEMRSKLQESLMKIHAEEAAKERATHAELDLILSKDRGASASKAEDESVLSSSEILSLKDKVRTLEEKLRESDAQLQLAKASIGTSQQQQSVLQSALSQVENVIEGLKANVLRTESRAEIAEAKYAELSKTNVELNEELFFLRNSESEKTNLLERRCQELDTQLEHAKASVEALEEQQNGLYAAISDMQNMIENLKTKVSKAESRAESAESKVTLLTETNLELNEEMGFLRGRLEYLERSLQQAEGAKTAIAKDIGIRTKTISDLVKKLALERERLQSQITALTKKNKILAEKCKTKENAHTSLSYNLEALTESSTTGSQVGGQTLTQTRRPGGSGHRKRVVMKRSLKLREAHKGTGSPALCSILWDADGRHLVTSNSSDPSVSIHDASHPPKLAKEIREHKDGVTALALSPGSNSLASGSVDHSVKIYSFPGMPSSSSSSIASFSKDSFREIIWSRPELAINTGFPSNVTRFTLPIRSLAFNKSGSLLAAAGDDDGIKLIATIDNTISKVLKGHRGPVTGLSFDPSNEFLASVDTFGTVIYWELSSGKQMHTLKAIAPNCDADASLINVLGWSPNGETLAVPGLKNDVVMYDRDTAEKMFTLKGDHERPVCFLAWSPNGKYMATAGLDKQVLIWDVDLRQDIERQKNDDRICSLAWKQNGNALAVIDVMGKIGIWESPVPSCMKSPTDGAADLQARGTNGLLLFDEDDETPSASGSLDDAIDESDGESAPVGHKRLRKQSISDEICDGDSDGEDGLLREIESRKRSAAKHKKHTRDWKQGNASSSNYTRPKMQEAFQPGSTPAEAGKRRFLVYNMLGSITTIENEGYSHVEVMKSSLHH
ncbi:hypothetical protein BHE74_00017983 [Ensete ventricosum]|nr:hypothetical protein BHE74_00017983 [Ensete ventricosum]